MLPSFETLYEAGFRERLEKILAGPPGPALTKLYAEYLVADKRAADIVVRVLIGDLVSQIALAKTRSRTLPEEGNRP